MTGPPLRLTVADFDALAVGQDASSDILQASQLSRRLLLLFGVLNQEAALARPEACASSALQHNVETLLLARQSNRDAVDHLVIQPQIGRWAMSCLRQVRDTSVADGTIQKELAYYGALAAVAAEESDLAREITVRIGADGKLALPTRGLLQLSPGARWAKIRSGPGLTLLDGGPEIRIGGERTVGAVWWPVRRLRSRANGRRIDVYLDDVDPYRCPPGLVASDRLSAGAVAEWRALLDAAWALLSWRHPDQAEALSRGVTSLTPMRMRDTGEELSASTSDGFGGVAVTTPGHPATLALALVHEYQHSKLSALLDLIPLYDPQPDRLFYAPWRPDPRPIRGLIQGAYAHLGLLLFWDRERRQQPGGAVAEYEFALWRQGVSVALDQLQSSGQLNESGQRFVAGMRRRNDELLALDVPGSALELATQTAADYRIGWRLRNLVPAEESMELWLRAWRTGAPGPSASSIPVEVRPGRRGVALTGRAGLARRRLAEPECFAALRDDPAALARTVAGATAADAALVSGDPANATHLYLTALRRSPADIDALTGLALARAHTSHPAAPVLLERPELVAALMTRLADAGERPDPDEVATWMTTTDRRAQDPR